MNTGQTSDKLFLDANSLLNDAFLLGRQILASGYRPDILIALWRGGTPVAIAIQELFAYQGIPHDHYAVKTRHYTGIDQRANEILIEGLEPVLTNVSAATRLLIVDDVFDTGLTLARLVEEIKRLSAVRDDNIRLATPWYKPANNQTLLLPDYYIHTTDRWIVFPHELQGLDGAEINAGKTTLPALRDFLY